MHLFDKKRFDRKKVPWITSNIKILINERDKFKRKAAVTTLESRLGVI